MNEEKFKIQEKKYWGKKFTEELIADYYHKPVIGTNREIRKLEKEKMKRGSINRPNKKQLDKRIDKLKEIRNMVRRIEYNAIKQLKQLKKQEDNKNG